MNDRDGTACVDRHSDMRQAAVAHRAHRQALGGSAHTEDEVARPRVLLERQRSGFGACSGWNAVSQRQGEGCGGRRE